MTDYYLGLDWGTSNSSLAYVFDEGGRSERPPPPETVKFQHPNGAEDPRMPSLVVGQTARGKQSLAAGWGAVRHFMTLATQQFRTPTLPFRHGANLFRSVKSDLGASRVYPYSCDTNVATPEDAAAMILREMAAAAESARPLLDLRTAPVVVSVPASLTAAARRETLAAAQKAGFAADRMELIDEPIAALLHALDHAETAAHLLGERPSSNILVYDYGGGTLDLCLVACRRDSRAAFGFEVKHLAISQYLRNGGNDIDAAIMEQVLWPQVLARLATERVNLPLLTQHAIADTLTALVARPLKEQISGWLKAQGWGRPAFRLTEAIEAHMERFALQAKFKDEGMPRPLKVDFEMSCGEFVEIMKEFTVIPYGDPQTWPTEYERSIFLPILDTVAKAGIGVEAVDAVLYHGGSCKNPLVVSALAQAFTRKDWLFPNATLVPSPSLSTSVAKGAALACWWRHVRSVDPVRPITAEAVGIADRNGRRHTMVSVSQPLPYPSAQGWSSVDETFCVPEDAARVMIVPWYTGMDRPHYMRLDLSSYASVRKFDPVAIEFRIDRDKVLQWRFKIGNYPPRDAECIEDPWRTRDPSNEQKQLADHRRAMKAWSETKPGQRFPRDMLFNEANLCRLAGDYETAESLCLEFLRAYPADANALNILAILCNSTGRQAQAVQYSAQAMKAFPSNAIFTGNHGYHLAEAGRNEEAEVLLRRALAMQENLVYVHERLGGLLRDMRRHDEADAEFRRGVELLHTAAGSKPPNRETLAGLTRLYRYLGERGKEEESAERYRQTEATEMRGGDERFVIAAYRSESE